MPIIGAHCTIDRPEPVRRVTPPSTTIPNTVAQQISSQIAIDLSESGEVMDLVIMYLLFQICAGAHRVF